MANDNNKILQICNVTDYMNDNLEKDILKYNSNKLLKTGFKNIDRHNKFLPGLYVLGAISGIGKTTFANQLADQIAEQEKSVLFISLEQSKLELVTKSLSRIMARQDADTARTATEIRTTTDTVYSDQIEHTARRFSAWLPPIQCTLSGHQCMMLIQV